MLAASFFLKRGQQVYFPIVQQSGVDFIVHQDGTYLEVQVKTASINKASEHSYLQCRTSATNKYPYSDYDLLVVVHNSDIWIIPKSDVDTTNLCLWGSLKGYRDKWEPYRYSLQGD